MITNNIVDLIGNTPLIKLKYPSEITNCEIYGKAEFLNPGGSIKDRTALGIILDAEKNKLIEPNGICVELNLELYLKLILDLLHPLL